MVNNDKSLIDAHINGDTTAFGELVRRYGDSLLGYLIRMSGSVEQAEDLFQETFKRVHQKADTFRGNRIKSWLFAIATNVAIDGFRRDSRLQVTSLNQKLDCDDGEERELSAVAVVDNSHEPSQKAIMSERKEQVRQALELLPAKQRATLVLAYYQQLSYPEVAQVLDCSVGTVKTQMYRALKTLAQRLPDISEDTK
ncbi:MAG: RNA polymerase sigma factor [Planctomycetota bacterium]